MMTLPHKSSKTIHTFNVRMYVSKRPVIDYDDLSKLAERLEKLLGPAIPDMLVWGLERPGLLTSEVLRRVSSKWWRDRLTEPLTIDVLDYPCVDVVGSWIAFDYLFSEITGVSSLASCLMLPGVEMYGEVGLKTTYLVTVALKPEDGIMFLLHRKGGKRIRRDLDNLAYIVFHALKLPDIKEVVFDRPILEKIGRRLQELGMRLVGVDRMKGIEAPEKMIMEGGSQRLSFVGRFGIYTLQLMKKTIKVSVPIRSGIFTFGLGRELVHSLEELHNPIKQELDPEKFVDLSYDKRDKAGILRAYTERRGVVASQYVAKEEYGVDARDVSYEFKGYDLEAGDRKIEVKSFKDTGTPKTIQLTRNEYEKMCEISGYEIFIVENVWDDCPRVNIIDPRNLRFDEKKREEEELRPETVTVSESFYECQEYEWRKVARQRHGKV